MTRSTKTWIDLLIKNPCASDAQDWLVHVTNEEVEEIIEPIGMFQASKAGRCFATVNLQPLTREAQKFIPGGLAGLRIEVCHLEYLVLSVIDSGDHWADVRCQVRLITNQPMQKEGSTGPSLGLVETWLAEVWHEGTPVRLAADNLHIAERSASWGREQGYEAGLKASEAKAQKVRDEELDTVYSEIVYGVGRSYITHAPCRVALAKELCAALRHKAISDKQAALNALDLIMSRQKGEFDGAPFDAIRNVLEALPDEN